MVRITAKILSAGGWLKATISRADSGLSANIGLAEKPISVVVGRVGANLSAKVGLVCTPNTDVYIRVNPNVLWFFTENEILDVDVMSNIKWIVK